MAPTRHEFYRAARERVSEQRRLLGDLLVQNVGEFSRFHLGLSGIVTGLVFTQGLRETATADPFSRALLFLAFFLFLVSLIAALQAFLASSEETRRHMYGLDLHLAEVLASEFRLPHPAEEPVQFFGDQPRVAEPRAAHWLTSLLTVVEPTLSAREWQRTAVRAFQWAAAVILVYFAWKLTGGAS